MHELWKELERTCERTTRELSQFNDRLEQNKNVISSADLDNLFKLMDIVKDTKSTMKKIIEIDRMEMEDELQNEGYSGASGYAARYPMWDRQYSGNNSYSGNSYKGNYSGRSGEGYSGRRGSSSRGSYSRDTEKEDMVRRLEDMMSKAKTEQEANAIRESIESISRL